MTRTSALCLALALSIAACAAPSQPLLDAARQQCTAGNRSACNAVPSLQATVNAEEAQQSRDAAIGILGALAIGAAAYGAATAPAYYPADVVVICRGC